MESLCWPSPYTLILGMLWGQGATEEEIEEKARILYEERRSCWSMEDYRIVLGFLEYAGMVVEEGKLKLDLEDPLDLEYAEIAHRSLVEGGVIDG